MAVHKTRSPKTGEANRQGHDNKGGTPRDQQQGKGKTSTGRNKGGSRGGSS